MKILGREVEAAGLWERVEERLRALGVELPSEDPPDFAPPPTEPRVDPVQHHLEAMERHSDPTVGLPLQTHRTGLGRAVLWAKWLFRKTCQPLINETLGRQRLFNSHVRDAYAELAGRVEKLTADLEALENAAAAKKPARAKPAAKPRAQGKAG